MSLAFDDKVVLRDVSFELRRGHTKIILGASGAGKSISLKLILGPAEGRWRQGLGERPARRRLTEDQMMKVRADIGMVFQEGALFDSLTVGENVGLQAVRGNRQPLDDVAQRVEEVLGFVGLSQFIDRKPSELSGGQRRRVAIARAMTVEARHPPVRRADDRARPDHEHDHRRRNRQASRPRGGHLDSRDAPAARCVLRRHAGSGATGRQSEFVDAGPAKMEEAEFMMLKDGVIIFEGTADELRASKDPYIQAFLS